ncbi:hypothetical protein AVEN_237056-1 [Araneus ventricosus]|uniref:Uncharacterized protein n=1 Tax=Araneus ventricosus TaxID=182803 RepID=A0A4Y2LZE8_ARAVE|nr:hypothetical protein AVEN_237056-1 [Araneus ventricosus]
MLRRSNIAWVINPPLASTAVCIDLSARNVFQLLYLSDAICPSFINAVVTAEAMLFTHPTTFEVFAKKPPNEHAPAFTHISNFVRSDNAVLS